MAPQHAAGPQATTIHQLPVQLLARILGWLDPTERLGAAALVATSWRAAAVLATQAVSMEVEEMSAAVPGQINSLSAWLAAHSSAGITAIEICLPQNRTNQPVLVLQLPLQRLQGLQSLQLGNVAVAQPAAAAGSAGPGAGGAAAAEGAPLPPLHLSVVTALTALHFHSSSGQLQGLSALTRLQDLSLGAPANNMPPDAVAASHEAELVAALPALQQLTFLQLDGELATDGVLQHVHSLPRLQALVLMDGVFSVSSFQQQLPQSLTRLMISCSNDITLSASTTPGISQLTGLQQLEVYTSRFSLELLAGLKSLRSLQLGAEELVDPGTLSVLAALTQLSRLVLPRVPAALAPSARDTAAVTASAQLVELDIGDARFPRTACESLFAAGRQLSQLMHLRADLDLLCTRSTAGMMAACCPNLRSLTLTPSSQEHWEENPMGQDETASHFRGVLRSLQPLSLTRLTLEADYLPMLPGVWQALGQLTQLQHLGVRFLSLSCLPGVLHLCSCQRLQELHVHAASLDLIDDVRIDLTGQELADGTTTLPQELPLALQQAVLHQLPEATTDPELLAVVLKAAAGVQQAQQDQLAQQRGEIAELKQQVRALLAGRDP